MKALTSDEWLPILNTAYSKDLKKLKTEEMAYNSLLEQFGEEGKDNLLTFCATSTPPAIKGANNDVKYRMMLLIVYDLSRCYFNICDKLCPIYIQKYSQIVVLRVSKSISILIISIECFCPSQTWRNTNYWVLITYTQCAKYGWEKP